MPGQGVGDRRDRIRRARVERAQRSNNAASIFRDYFGGDRANAALLGRPGASGDLQGDEDGDFIYVDDMENNELLELADSIVGERPRRIIVGGQDEEDQEEDDDDEEQEDYDQEEEDLIPPPRINRSNIKDSEEEEEDEYGDEKVRSSSSSSSQQEEDQESEEVKPLSSESSSSSNSENEQEDQLPKKLLEEAPKLSTSMTHVFNLNFQPPLEEPLIKHEQPFLFDNPPLLKQSSSNPGFGDAPGWADPPVWGDRQLWGNVSSQSWKAFDRQENLDSIINNESVQRGRTTGHAPRHEMSQLYKDIIRDHHDILAGGRNFDQFNRESAAIKRKRLKKLEEKRLLRERKTRILRDSIFDRKGGQDTAKFVPSADLRFQASSINAINQKIQTMIKKHFQDAKDISNKEKVVTEAKDLVIDALTNSAPKVIADPMLLQKIQDSFKLTKDEAEKVLMIRNELQLIDHQIEKKINAKDKTLQGKPSAHQPRYHSRYSLAGSQANVAHERGKVRTAGLTTDIINQSVAEYKTKNPQKVANHNSKLIEIMTSGDEADEQEKQFLPSREYLERVDLMFSTLNARLQKK